MTRDAADGPDTEGLLQGWFRIDRFDAAVIRISEPLHVEDVASFLILGERRALLVDTGMGVAGIREVVERLTELPVTVVNSHAHWDHIGGNHLFANIAIHQAEAHELPLGVGNERLRRAFTPDQLVGSLPESFEIERFTIQPSVASSLLSGGERFDLGGRTIDVIHAPGHSPGGIALIDRDNRALFSTDVAYAGPLYAFGRDANLDDYRTSLANLAALVHNVDCVYGSHNASPFEPRLLVEMRDGLESIVEGRRADGMDGPIARHEFGGFSILIDPGLITAEGR